MAKSKMSNKPLPKINEEIAKRVLEVVDKGLTDGIGEAVPGEMCVEAAVCYAMGEPHTDRPRCVEPAIRDFKINLNDHESWRNDKSRAAGLRRLAIAQLGSKGKINGDKFNTALENLVLTKYAPMYYKAATQRMEQLSKHAQSLANATGKKRKALTRKYEDEDTVTVISLDLSFDDNGDVLPMLTSVMEEIHPVSYDGSYIARQRALKAQEKILVEFAEDVVQILVKLKSPGCKFLYLTEAPTK